MKNQKGITLISLVVTIVIMAIITGVVSYSGLQSINDTKRMTFISELEMIQAKINVIYEKIKSNENDAKYYNNLGIDCSMMEDEKITTALGETSKEGFRYFSTSDLRAIGLDNINQQVLVNYNTREVVSITGIEIEGVMYYKLKDIPNYTGYNVEHTDTNTEEPTFTVEKTKLSDSYRFTIKDIVYNSNVTGGTLSYKLHSDTNWVLNGDSTSFEVSEPGLYDIRFTDTAGNSTVVQDWFYVDNGLIIHLDAENNTGTGHSNTITTWTDLSENRNDFSIYGTDTTSWKDNYLYLDGVDDYVSKTNITVDGKNGTVEMIAKFISGTYMFRSDASSYRTYIKPSIVTKGSSSTVVTFNKPEDYQENVASRVLTYYTNSLNESFVNAYFNNNKSEEVSFSGTDDGSYISLGSFYATSANQSASMNLYGVRIYDRALTDEEIAINYEIDKHRFNLE